jgi:GH18 family chitinase
MHRIWQAAAPLLALLLASCNSMPTWDNYHSSTPKPGWKIPDGFRIVGYFPSWSGDPAQVRYEALTHINYAFGLIKADGTYGIVDQADKLQAVVQKAHAQGVKVLLSVAGLDSGATKALDTVSADPALLETLCNSTLALLDLYQLDGIDIDWEFPDQNTAAHYSALVVTLSAALHAHSRLLTLAVSADHGAWVTDDAWKASDWLNIMAYDDGWHRQGVAHSTYGFTRAQLDYWLNRGVPPAKTVIGVPFYGRSLVTWRSKSYSALLREFPEATDSDVAGGYAYTGPDSMRAKIVNQARVRAGGVMIWQLNQDAKGPASLLSLIYDTVKEPVE